VLDALKAAAPSLSIGISEYALRHLPPAADGRPSDAIDGCAALAAAGFQVFETSRPAAALAAGLVPTALARTLTVREVHETARRNRDLGYACTVLHVGTGMEDDRGATELLEAVVDAARTSGHVLYVETHRATVTQDPWRTLRLCASLPELAFNCDFSHWYTGSELNYGDLGHKLASLTPVLRRCGYVHGRVSSPGCIQVALEEARRDGHLPVFERVWLSAFESMRESPSTPHAFVVEVLPAEFQYARRVRGADGVVAEETDRWQEALALAEFARQLWRRADDLAAGASP
jgi:hypothetical protein